MNGNAVPHLDQLRDGWGGEELVHSWMSTTLRLYEGHLQPLPHLGFAHMPVDWIGLHSLPPHVAATINPPAQNHENPVKLTMTLKLCAVEFSIQRDLSPRPLTAAGPFQQAFYYRCKIWALVSLWIPITIPCHMDITKSPEDFGTLFTGQLEKITNMLKLSQKK